MMERTVNMTPTWESAVSIYIAVLENGTETGKQSARAELIRLARMMDKINKESKK